MDNIINRIVEMDRKAKAITDSALQEKANANKEIAARAEVIRSEYLAMARRRIAVNAQTERTMAEEGWAVKKSRYQSMAQSLEAQYAANADEWVSRILQRTTQTEELPADDGG